MPARASVQPAQERQPEPEQRVPELEPGLVRAPELRPPEPEPPELAPERELVAQPEPQPALRPRHYR